jgi:hypothetical protein
MTQADNLENAAPELQSDKFPPLIKAAFTLIFVNILVMLWFVLSVSFTLATPVKIDQQAASQTSEKASPFQEVSVDRPHKAVRRPARIEPYFAETVRFDAQPSDGSVN